MSQNVGELCCVEGCSNQRKTSSAYCGKHGCGTIFYGGQSYSIVSIDALAAKDAEIARLTKLVEAAYREGYRDACELWNSWDNEDERWEVSDARRALEEEEDD